MAKAKKDKKPPIDDMGFTEPKLPGRAHVKGKGGKPGKYIKGFVK